MRIKTRITAFIIAAVSAVQLLSGCAFNNGEKEKVTVALWASQLLEDYAPWLQEQFPDVDLDFYVINNSTDYYMFRAERDELPDIMTVRRFSLRDVEPLKDKLLDLSDTQLANTFYRSYLRNYTYSDGTVNWLPACAEIDDLIVNKTLFEQYNIPLPTDYESFVYACREFEKHGITGFASDFFQDYTCMETLQGFSASQLMSASGRNWRQEYESGTTDTLSEEAWLPIFEKMQRLIADTGLNADSLNLGTSDILNGFDQGKIAMYRGTGADLTTWGTDYEQVMLPYPGDTEEESFYLTYPAFQAAASSRANESDERRELILDIMETMLSEDGLSHISTGKNMIAYNKDVQLELIPAFENIKSYITENRIYIRIASSDMFSVSSDVVSKMLTGEIKTAREAYDEFNRLLAQDDEQDDTASETAAVLSTGYSRKFNPESGNAAASAIYNSLREDLGADMVIGQSAIVAGDILKGAYTKKELNFIVSWGDGKLVSMSLTGAQIYDLVQYMLDVKGSRDSVANDSTLPVSSGFEMEISKTDDGYSVDKLTINGEDLDKNKTYSIVTSVTYEPDLAGFEDAGFTGESLDKTLKGVVLNDRLLTGKQLSKPTSYITLR